MRVDCINNICSNAIISFHVGVHACFHAHACIVSALCDHRVNLCTIYVLFVSQLRPPEGFGQCPSDHDWHAGIAASGRVDVVFHRWSAHKAWPLQWHVSGPSWVCLSVLVCSVSKQLITGSLKVPLQFSFSLISFQNHFRKNQTSLVSTTPC